MVDEFSCNNPRDEAKERFSKIEEQITNISCEMAFLMVALENKFGPFEEVGVSSLKAGSFKKLGDREDPKGSTKF